MFKAMGRAINKTVTIVELIKVLYLMIYFDSNLEVIFVMLLSQ